VFTVEVRGDVRGDEIGQDDVVEDSDAEDLGRALREPAPIPSTPRLPICFVPRASTLMVRALSI